MKNNTKVVLMTLAIFLFMALYRPLISLFLPNLENEFQVVIRKLLQALTIILYVTKLKWWYNIGDFKKISRKSLYLMLPIILFSFVPLINGIKEMGIADIILLVGISVLIGIIEEFYFRGVIFSALKTEKEKSAILISSMLFGIVHLLNLTNGADLIDTLFQVVFAFGLGLTMAVIRYETDLLLPQILAHALWDFNFAISNTDFSPLLDNVHTVSIVLVIIWGLFLAYKVLKRKGVIYSAEQSL